MVTISHLVKKSINESTFLQECIIKDIVSYTNLAADIQPFIEQELGTKVKTSAIIMALRRHAEELKERGLREISKNLLKDMIIKTNVIDICLEKTENTLTKIKELHEKINYEYGEFINIINGDNELVIVTNESCIDRVNKIFTKTEIKTIEKSIVSINLKFKGDFLHTPGVIYSVLRELAWFDINIYEIISTNLELNLIIHKKDFTKAYNIISKLFE